MTGPNIFRYPAINQYVTIFFQKKVTEQVTFDRSDMLSMAKLVNFRDNFDQLNLNHRFIELSGYGFWICTGKYNGTKFGFLIGCTPQGRDSTKEHLHRYSIEYQGSAEELEQTFKICK